MFSIEILSGSYDMNESRDGPTKMLGSADTSMDRHTISMSSEEWYNSVNYHADSIDSDSNHKALVLKIQMIYFRIRYIFLLMYHFIF